MSSLIFHNSCRRIKQDDKIQKPRLVHIYILLFVMLSEIYPTAPKIYGATEKCGISEVVPNHRTPRRRSKLFSLFSNIFENSDIFRTQSSRRHKRSHHSYRRGRIIQGKETKDGSWPWQVSVRLNIPGFGNIGHWCGGVLIKPGWVLTSAHCVQNKLVKTFQSAKFTVVFSKTSIGGYENEFNLKDEGIEIEKYYVNDGFAEYQHDIALLKLSHKEIPSDSRSPVCLPTQDSGLSNETFLGIRCIATGWGQKSLGGKLQTKLREVELRVVDNKHCRDMYGLMHNIVIQNYHLCAGPILQGGKGTCIGDSGGPLHCNMKDGRWYLAGLTSFGSGCAKPGYPDVFMRLTSYTKWIEETIQNHHSH